MLDTHRMWLMALDTVTGRPREPAMVTAVAATLLLELVDRHIVTWDGDVVTSSEQHTPGWTTVLEFGRVRLLEAGPTDYLRPTDAISALHEDVWATVGDDLAASGITVRRPRRLLRRTPRWDLPDPQARVDVVRALCRAVRSSDTLDPGSRRLAVALWATDTEEHGLCEDSLFNDEAASWLAPIMDRDLRAADLTQAVAYLINPTAAMGGSPTFS